MRPLFKQTLVFLLLLLALTIIRYPYSEFVLARLQQVMDSAKTRGIELSVARLRLGFPLEVELFDSKALFPPASPDLSSLGKIDLLVDSFLVRPSFLPLLVGNLSGTTKMSAYSGSGAGNFSRGLFAAKTSIEFSGTGFALDQQRVLSQLNIGGTAKIESKLALNEAKTLADSLDNATLNIEVLNGFYRGGHKIAGLVTLPSFEKVELRLQANQQAKNISIENLEIFSSQGSLIGQGAIEIDSNLVPKIIDFSSKLELTSEGTKHFGPYLALAAGASLEQPGRNWNLRVTQNANEAQPRFVVSPG